MGDLLEAARWRERDDDGRRWRCWWGVSTFMLGWETWGMGRESRDDRDADESLRRWMRGTGGGAMATTDVALHGLAVWAHATRRFHLHFHLAFTYRTSIEPYIPEDNASRTDDPDPSCMFDRGLIGYNAGQGVSSRVLLTYKPNLKYHRIISYKLLSSLTLFVFFRCLDLTNVSEKGLNGFSFPRATHLYV